MDKRISIAMFAMLTITIAFALQIESGTSEDLTIFLQNFSSGDPIESASCYMDVWNTTNTRILDDGVMSELSDGFYYYSTNASWTDIGDHRVLARCDIGGGENVFAAMVFEIVETTITGYLEEINTTTTDTEGIVTDINTTVNSIYDYLQNTLYPAIDETEAKLDGVLANQTDIWNKLVEVQANVTTNYDELISVGNQLVVVNETIMAELADHANRLAEINTTSYGILTNISLTVNPKLDQLQTDIDLIKGYTDSLESGQSTMQSDLTTIKGYTDSVESDVAALQADVTSLNSTNTARFDSIDSDLSNIYVDTQSIINSGVSLDAATNTTLYSILTVVTSANTTINSVEAYIEGTVTNYLSEINTTTTDTEGIVTDINTTVNSIYDYLQNTIYPAVDQTEAKLDQVLINTSNIWNKLIVIENNVTTNYNELVSVGNQLVVVNETIMAELADHANRLGEINTTTTQILTNITATVNPKLDQLQTDIDLIKGYTDTLESGQSTMQSDLTTIKGYTDSVESDVAVLQADVTSLNSTNTARFDSIDSDLANIYSDTQSIINSGVSLDSATNTTLYSILNVVTNANTTINDVEAYIEGTITDYLYDINTTVTAAYAYLQNTIYPAVDETEAKLDSVLANQTAMWNKLLDVETDVATNLAAINDVSTELAGVNNSIMTELVDHRNRLIEINTTTMSILINITDVVIPKLNTLESNQNTMDAALDLLINYTDTLESGQSTMTTDLTTIKGYTDTLETGISNLQSDITSLNQTNTARFDSIDSDLSNIYTDTQSIINSGVALDAVTNTTLYTILSLSQESNTTIHDVEDYMLGTVAGFLTEINTTLEEVQEVVEEINETVVEINTTLEEVQETVNTINTTVNNIYDYLQNTIYPSIDSLEGDMAKVLTNTSNIWNKLVTVETDVDTNYNQLVAVSNRLTSINASTMAELAEHANRLAEINTTTKDIQNSILTVINPKLDTMQSNLTVLVTELALVKQYVDTLETGQSSMSSDLTTIIGYTDTLEAGITQLTSDISTLNATNTARFDSIDSDLADIYTDTQSVINSGVHLDTITNATLYDVLTRVNTINTSVNEVEAYIEGTITDYLDDINYTVSASFSLLSLMNVTLTNTYTDTQDILTNWGSYDMDQLFTELNNIDSQLDTIQTASNNSDVLAAVAQLEAITNLTRDELGFTGQGLTAYEYFVQLESTVISINATLFNKIEFEGNLTRSQVMSALQSNFTLMSNLLSNNSDDLSSILLKWGSSDASDIIANITENRNQMIAMDNWLEAFNTTEEQRHNESMTVGQNILDWLAGFDSDEITRHTLTQELINNLSVQLNGTEALSNDIIAQLGYSGMNTTVYDDVQETIVQNTQIQVMLDEINLTTHTTQDIINDEVLDDLNTIKTVNQIILGKWGVLDADEIYDRAGSIETKIDTMQVWLDSFNDTEKARYDFLFARINSTEDIVTDLRAEVGFAGMNITTYEYLVALDTALEDINSSFNANLITELNLTKQEILTEIQNVSGILQNNISANLDILNQFISEWESTNLTNLANITQECRNDVIDVKNLVLAYNATEEERYQAEVGWLQSIITTMGLYDTANSIRHQDTQDLVANISDKSDLIINTSNEILIQVGFFNDTNASFYVTVENLMEVVVNLTADLGNFTGVDYVVLGSGENVIALPMAPTNTSISYVVTPIEDELIRVDWYNKTSEEYLVYNPEDPIGSDLDTMERYKAYTVWVEGDTILFVN